MTRAVLYGILLGLVVVLFANALHDRVLAELNAHHCQMTGRHRWGGMTVVVQGDGTTIPITLPDEYEWKCDDKTRWL